MEYKSERFLPIGSVVTTDGSEKKLMIIGYLVSQGLGKKIYDYIACLYPEGVISAKESIAFDHSNINRVYSLGYSDDAQKTLIKNIKKLDQSIKRPNPNDVKKFFDIATSKQ